eukprot:GHVS01097341.1.p1 GENE.GHVS01097341.1~~GHVS01097341.1.p1  ORF type:complete len:423 (-),score=94.59 GHVS01097341.1:696-1964(-)
MARFVSSFIARHFSKPPTTSATTKQQQQVNNNYTTDNNNNNNPFDDNVTQPNYYNNSNIDTTTGVVIQQSPQQQQPQTCSPLFTTTTTTTGGPFNGSTPTAAVIVPFAKSQQPPPPCSSSTCDTYSGINSLYVPIGGVGGVGCVSPTTGGVAVGSAGTASGQSTPSGGVVGDSVVVVCDEGRRMVDSAKVFTSESLTTMRNVFAVKVYGLLTACLFVTFGLSIFFTAWSPASEWMYANQWLGWLCCAIAVALVMALWFWKRMALMFPVGILSLLLLSIACGVILGHIVTAPPVVAISAGMAFLMVLSIALLSAQSRIDFTSLLLYPFVLLVSLILFGVVVLIFRASTNWLHLLYATIAVFAMSLYMVAHTQRVVGGSHCLHRFTSSEWSFAVVSMATDVVSFFALIVSILTCRKCRHKKIQC